MCKDSDFLLEKDVQDAILTQFAEIPFI